MNPIDLILDSGAYSVWKTQGSLDVGEYIDFILQYTDCIHEYVNLDQIPGQLGRANTSADVERSAEVGWNNLLTMEKAGLKAMPVFHFGERRYWLEKMLDHGCHYIGISPANNTQTSVKQKWLDEIYGYLCGQKGYPEVKTHGFGVTSLPLLFRYPWYSVDSITWILVAAYGGILVPATRPDGSPDYSGVPTAIFFSKKSSMEKHRGGVHYDSMGEGYQAHVRKYVESLGFKVEDLSGHYVNRQRVNCGFFQGVEKAYTIQPFRERKSGLFGPALSERGSLSRLNEHVKIVFTVTLAAQHSAILNEFNCQTRLMSYWYFKSGHGFDLRGYIETGLIPKKARKVKVKV